MSEYTPTTAAIREELCMFHGEGYDAEIYDVPAQFDRWYAAEIRKAKKEALMDLVNDLHSTGGFQPGKVIDTGRVLRMIAAEAARLETTDE